jgi:DNA invertase Pin-like site-specific DNA recombinase
LEFSSAASSGRRGAVPFDVLLIQSLCRLSRHPARLALLLKRLERANVQVRAITGEMPDLLVDPVQGEGKVR